MKPSTPRVLNAKTGWMIFAACWFLSLASVWALRQALIPRDELDCYSRAALLDQAVHGWNQAHPDRVMDEKGEIDEASLVSGGFLKQPLTYDHAQHYYFVDKMVHGPLVHCNKHQDQPLALKITGVTLLAVLAFILWCSFRNYVFWKSA